MKEVFKLIKGFSKYSVSNYGRIKLISGKYLKPTIQKKGYLRVTLISDNGERKSFQLHRLIAEMFILNKGNLPQINHKNTNKKDNAVNNLEWVTNFTNKEHARFNNLVARGNKIGVSKLNESQVLEIRKLYATGDYTQRELGKRYSVDYGGISKIIRKKIWTHI